MSILRQLVGTAALGGAMLLVTGTLLACGAGRPGAGAGCTPTPPPVGPPPGRSAGLGSGGGSERQTARQAPLAELPTPIPAPPTPSGGRLVLTADDSPQTVTVPRGTIIEIRLEPVDGAVWTVPKSSNPNALPRLSASGACDRGKVATFRAEGTGEIRAIQPSGGTRTDSLLLFRVTVWLAN